MCKTPLLVSAFILLFTLCSSAQKTDTTSTKYYFDDGGVSTSKYILKLETVSLIHGEAPASIEWFVKRNFSLEPGVGLILPYYVHDFLPLAVGEKNSFTNSTFGVGLWLSAKFYLRESPEGHYWQFQFRDRSFSSMDLREFSFSLGKQKIIGSRYTCDYGIGVGVRLNGGTSSSDTFDNFSLIIPLYLKFGYILKN